MRSARKDHFHIHLVPQPFRLNLFQPLPARWRRWLRLVGDDGSQAEPLGTVRSPPAWPQSHLVRLCGERLPPPDEEGLGDEARVVGHYEDERPFHVHHDR